MATQIVIANKDYIKVDDNYHMYWVDRGNAMPVLPDTIHYVIWNDLLGQNEIQNKDASGNMTGNMALNSTSDAVAASTVAELLAWADTRMSQIKSAQLDNANYKENASIEWVKDGNDEDNFWEGNSATSSYIDWSKMWIDFDDDYS
tara:strand:- start:4333 stop:4770 length:438 start_codon:yes stop_codon:yes gene_type:complete